MICMGSDGGRVGDGDCVCEYRVATHPDGAARHSTAAKVG